MGPLRTLDEVGFDVALDVGQSLTPVFRGSVNPEDMDFVLGAIQKMIDSGRMGRKGGKGNGFYNYDNSVKEDTKGTPEFEIAKILGLKPDYQSHDKTDITDRLILPIVNESIKAVNIGIAGSDIWNAARQCDLGSIYGYGFAKQTGGVILYAENLGAFNIYKRLQTLASRYPNQGSKTSRFTPCEYIKARSRKNLSFYAAI